MDNKNHLEFLEKHQLLDKIRNEMGSEKAFTAFLESVRKSYGLGKELFDEFISTPDTKYAHARFILCKHLFNPHIKATNYIGYLRENNLVSNMRDVLDRIERSFKGPSLANEKKFVLFLDGDNLSNLLTFKKLKELSFKVQFHVCLFLTKDIINDSMMGYEHEEWLSIIYSETRERDAADNCITFLMGRVDSKLDRMDCDFILVTRDHFYREMISQFEKYFDRQCHHSNTMDGLEELLENNETCLRKRPRSLSSSTVTEAIPLHSVEIMKLDQKDLSPEFLIDFFKKFWLGSGKSQASLRLMCLEKLVASRLFVLQKNNTRFDMILLDYYSSFIDCSAICNFAIRVNQNVAPIHIFSISTRFGENGDSPLIQQHTNYYHQNIIEIDTEKSQLQSQKQFSLFDTAFILEMHDGINVYVTSN
ncbi:predicted protein [Naegleria gruberi]|uniref:Predicted protein n=1 Tax=Naegleria gruberi TaxID=5762 RepID=D2VDV3_NAEGR|nr:uncharacterized protein NAEGRDRAFT_48746 [Naegleria gruberi]EFC44967.1 predicted protein [Naegleria gruberi]|eukprot:XP_002677711.1 predicted protein [Naegleria gruberi strain NEG-M]